MTTPSRNEIIEKAFELHHKRNHNVSSITPTEAELKETGVYEEARRELMRNDHPYRDYIEQEAGGLGLIDREHEPEHTAFTVNLEEAMNTGIFISGTSQSGKGNTAFIIADMLMRKGVIVYAIDSSQVWHKSSIPNRIVVEYPRRGKGRVTWKDGHVSCSTVFDISRFTILQQKELSKSSVRRSLRRE